MIIFIINNYLMSVLTFLFGHVNTLHLCQHSVEKCFLYTVNTRDIYSMQKKL